MGEAGHVISHSVHYRDALGAELFSMFVLQATTGRILSPGMTTNGWEITEDPNGQDDHRGAKGHVMCHPAKAGHPGWQSRKGWQDWKEWV